MKPVRTCVGCRQRASRTDLIRVVCIQQKLEPDLLGSAPGRGAWLHASSNCLKTAIDRKAFGRALKSNQQLETSVLITFIEKAETMLATNE